MLDTLLAGTNKYTRIYIDGAEVLSSELDMKINVLNLKSEDSGEDDSEDWPGAMGE
jgi:hypothetical protein